MSTILYDTNDILVDASRYMVQGTMYPINAIASVCAYKHDKSADRLAVHSNWKNENADARKDLKANIKNSAIFALVASAVFYFFTNWIGFSIFALALALLIYAIYKSNQFKDSIEPSGPADSFSVKISTSAGETDSYRSYNEREIYNIVDAINEAVLSRG